MAQITQVRLVDDLDDSGNTEAAETVPFGLDSASYEIDLSEENAAQLRDVLAPFVAAARRVNTGRQTSTSSPRPSSASPRRDLSEVRTWLNENGYTVSGRGRISGELLAAYESKTPASEGQHSPVEEAVEAEKPKRSRKDGPSEGSNVVQFSGATASGE